MADITNPGPLKTSTFDGLLEALPPEIRAGLTIVRTVQSSNLDTAVASLGPTTIESTLEQGHRNERTKTVVTLDGIPLTQSGKGYTTEFGGGGTTITRTFNYGSAVTPAGSLKLLTHRVSPAVNGFSIEDKEELTASSWPVLHGQEWDRTIGVPIRFTEQTIAENTQLGTARSQIDPFDKDKARIRTYDLSALATVLVGDGTASNKGVYYTQPGYTDVDLPTQLVALLLIFNRSEGAGTNEQNGEGGSTGTSASLSLSISSRAQGSAAIVPELVIVTKGGRKRGVLMTEVVFYMALNQTEAQMLTRLKLITGFNDLQVLPTYNEVAHTVVVKGQSVSVSAEASVQQHIAGTADSFSYTRSTGVGRSFSNELTNRVYNIPACIHPRIEVAVSNNTKVASASAKAHITGGFNGIWATMDAGDPTNGVTNTRDVVADVVPRVLPTTATYHYDQNGLAVLDNPDTLPSSGHYIVGDVQIEPVPQYGVARGRVKIVDFANVPIGVDIPTIS